MHFKYVHKCTIVARSLYARDWFQMKQETMIRVELIFECWLSNSWPKTGAFVADAGSRAHTTLLWQPNSLDSFFIDHTVQK